MICIRLREAAPAILALLLVACERDSDFIASRYATAAHVRRDEAIERGWIPVVLPESATDISESHDLDLNTGSGTFSFSLAEAAAFRTELRPLPPTVPFRRIIIDRADYERQGFNFYSFEDFYLAVNWRTGKVHFWLAYDYSRKAA